MFTIEHEFDATVVTLFDEGTASLQEDVIVNGCAERLTIDQNYTRLDPVQKATFSIA